MKGARFASEARVCAFIFESAVEFGQLARWVIDSDPEHLWLSCRWECAAALDADFEWFDLGGSDCSGGRKMLDLRERNVAEKFQGEVQIIFATPACSSLGDGRAQMIDVIDDSCA